jgi:hypothetical protein
MGNHDGNPALMISASRREGMLDIMVLPFSATIEKSRRLVGMM